ncbi:hypothetical protein Tco_0271187 [Tanacetum coccineum]
MRPWDFYILRFSEAIVDIDVEAEEMETARFGLYWVEGARQISNKGDLSAYLRGISSEWDLCQRLIACNIAWRSHAPEKVTVTDLFYLRGTDVGSVNIPYLLARYLRMFASGRKREAIISRGRFFCEELDDTCAWVALRPERQLDATAGAPEVIEGAHDVDEGAQRIARLEEDMHGMRRALAEQREVLDSMAHDFSRFTTWTITSLSRMMDQAGVKYTSYADF